MLRRTFQETPIAPDPQLEILCRSDSRCVRLIVRGEIDLASAPALDRELRDAESSARRIILDLAGLGFIDSTGIHMLVDAQHRADSNRHELVLTRVPAHALRLFGLTGVDSLLSIE